MEPWFAKSVLAMLSITPVFIAIPFFKNHFGVDPLVFLVWYFGATAASIAALWALSENTIQLVPPPLVLGSIVAIGALLGAAANGLLFQAVGMAPNPGLPPVIYATSSMLVFAASATLAGLLPQFFRGVDADFSRLGGIVLVIGGLYLLAGGRILFK